MPLGPRWHGRCSSRGWRERFRRSRGSSWPTWPPSLQPSRSSPAPGPTSAPAKGWGDRHVARLCGGRRALGAAHALPRLCAAAPGAILMTAAGWIQLAVFSAVVLALTKPLGAYLYRVFESERRPLPRVLGPIERLLVRLCGVDVRKEQTWKQYAGALLAFSLFSVLTLYLIQ